MVLQYTWKWRSRDYSELPSQCHSLWLTGIPVSPYLKRPQSYCLLSFLPPGFPEKWSKKEKINFEWIIVTTFSVLPLWYFSSRRSKLSAENNYIQISFSCRVGAGRDVSAEYMHQYGKEERAAVFSRALLLLSGLVIIEILKKRPVSY